MNAHTAMAMDRPIQMAGFSLGEKGYGLELQNGAKLRSK